MATIKIKYGIDDGYAGGSRPHYVKVDTEDFDGMEEEDVKAAIWEIIEDDMQNHVHPYWSGDELPEVMSAIEAEQED